jgi:hypothetical protein
MDMTSMLLKLKILTQSKYKSIESKMEQKGDKLENEFGDFIIEHPTTSTIIGAALNIGMDLASKNGNVNINEIIDSTKNTIYGIEGNILADSTIKSVSKQENTNDINLNIENKKTNNNDLTVKKINSLKENVKQMLTSSTIELEEVALKTGVYIHNHPVISSILETGAMLAVMPGNPTTIGIGLLKVGSAMFPNILANIEEKARESELKKLQLIHNQQNFQLQN